MVRRRLVAGALVMMMAVASASASARYAVPYALVSPLSAAHARAVTGGSWWECVGAVAAVAAAASTGGIGGGLLGLAASLGFSVATVCSCAPYLDSGLGTDFSGFCGS